MLPSYGQDCESKVGHGSATHTSIIIIARPPCRIRSDRQTTSLTLTTGVCKAGTKMRGASNMNIHYDVIGLLTAAWRSDSGQIVWAA